MTTYQEIDRLVVADDAVAARLWPRLGPKVRGAYTSDRDAWVALRRKVDKGEALPGATLNAQHKVFTGWARAFHVATGGRPKPAAPAPGRPAPAAAATTAAAPLAATATAASTAALATAAEPAAAMVAKAKGGGSAGTAVAGLLVLAGITAAAATRKRA